MAAPSFIAKSAAQASTAATFGVGYMGSILPGDILMLYLLSKSNVSPSTPAGWLHRSGGFFNDNGITMVGNGHLFVKIADGTESGSVTITRNGAVAGLEFTMGQMYQFRGDPGTGVGNTITNTLGDGSSTITWDSITTGSPEATAVAIVGQLTSSTSAGTPAGYTEVAVDTIDTGPVSASLEVSVRQNATPGGATASGGSSNGWVTTHSMLAVAAFGRSYIVN